ncbi:hypothetical protein ACFL5V_00725 [Fibrobacterota bacterium]
MSKINLMMLMLLLAFFGCGKKAQEDALERAIEKKSGGKADIDLSEGNINIETEDGSVSINTGKGARLPDGFSPDVYVYKGAEVVMSMDIPGGNLVTLSTGDDAKTVMDSYKKELTAKGWVKTGGMDRGDQNIYMAEKGSRRINVMAISIEGATQIRITVAEK